MNDSRAAIRYARAILDLALEKKVADAVEQDMQQIVQTVSSNKEVEDMLGNPVIKGSDKKEALIALFKGINPMTEGVLSMLVDNKRIGMLREVAFKYLVLYREKKGEEEAVITTAVPLTPEIEKKALKQIASMTENKVTLTNKVDEEILGGFVLRIGDMQYDASIATQLNNIKREFTNSL